MNPGRVLKGMVRALGRSWWTVVAGVALGLTLGVALLEQFPERHRAQMALPPITDRAAVSPLESSIVERLAQRAGAEDRAAFRASLSYRADDRSGQRLLSAVALEAPQARAIVNHWARILDGPQAELADTVTVASIATPAASLFCFLGLAIGLLLFVGPLLIRGAIDPLIWEAAPMGELDVPLIAVIPRIPTPDVRAERRRRALINFGLSGICLAILSLVVLTHVS